MEIDELLKVAAKIKTALKCAKTGIFLILLSFLLALLLNFIIY